MGEVDMILSLTPAAIHVVTACRGLGIPAFLNLERHGVRLVDGARLVNDDGVAIGEGEWVTVSSRRRAVYKGRARFSPARLEKHLEGEAVELDPQEAADYAGVKEAYDGYRGLVESLEVEQIESLDDLVKLVRMDLRGDTDIAADMVSAWFDSHSDCWVRDLLTSQLGTHLERYRVYEYLTTDRRAELHRRTIAACRAEKLSGYSAGSFMLGRFVAIEHPVAFWEGLQPADVAFLLDEWVQFLQYQQLLDDVGERRISRARQAILDRTLAPVDVTAGEAWVFAPLKLSRHDLEVVEAAAEGHGSRQTLALVALLREPWSALVDFGQAWSQGRLEQLCEREGVPVPAPGDL